MNELERTPLAQQGFDGTIAAYAAAVEAAAKKVRCSETSMPVGGTPHTEAINRNLNQWAKILRKVVAL